MCAFLDAFFARRDCQQLWLHHWNFSMPRGTIMICLVDRGIDLAREDLSKFAHFARLR